MVNWHIGCSGFYYKHWKEIFYPHGLAQSKWFDFYCRHFSSLELNVTFYRFPPLSFFENWYSKSPEGFTFSVKAPRMITHYKKFTGTEKLMDDFYATAREGLKEKLGCILFQMPPRFDYTEERLDKIINSLDPSFDNVLEFRNETWWNAGVYHKMAGRQVSFCGMSHPALPQTVVQNTGVLYYRFHGVPHLYASRYEETVLRQFAGEVENSGISRKAFVYFNNDIGGSAIVNAQELQDYCMKKG